MSIKVQKKKIILGNRTKQLINQLLIPKQRISLIKIIKCLKIKNNMFRKEQKSITLIQIFVVKKMKLLHLRTTKQHSITVGKRNKIY